MIKIPRDINQQDFKIAELAELHFVISGYLHSLEVVGCVSETQLHVGENSNKII